jgi:hypothetical protein
VIEDEGAFLDIDTPDEYARAAERFGVRLTTSDSQETAWKA